MNASWPIARFEEVLEITSSKRIFMADYVPYGVPFYRGKEIIEKAQGEQVSTPLYISENKFAEINTKFGAPKSGDILLTSVGTLGVPYRVTNDERFYFKDGNLTWFRNFSDRVDSLFVYHWLKSDMAQAALDRITIGSTQKALTIASLKKLEIPLPPLPIQKRIAEILGRLDDKIEVNRRINRTLEAMAQALYKHWFVDFGPFQDGPFVDSELGPIPEGWAVVSLKTLFPSHSDCVLTGPFGSKLHASDYRDTGTPLILVKHVDQGRISEQGLPLVGEHKLAELGRYVLRHGDIVVTRVGYVGRTAYVHPEYEGWLISGQTLRVRIPNKKRLDARFLAQYYLSDRFIHMIEAHSVGSTRQSLNTKILLSQRFLLPPIAVQEQYSEQVNKFDRQIQILTRESAHLTSIRDYLLPKLLSGEVPVTAVEQMTEEVMP